MTREELLEIKEQLSQIIDDIAGNPDWQEAAVALASDIGTLERNLEKIVIEPLQGLDEAAEEISSQELLQQIKENHVPMELVKAIFKAGAKWMEKQLNKK